MEFTGKSVEEAVNNGLEILGISKEDADIVVVKDSVMGLFGKIKEEAVVRVTEKKEILKAQFDKVLPSREPKKQDTEKQVIKEVKEVKQVVEPKKETKPENKTEEPKPKKVYTVNKEEVLNFTETLLEKLGMPAKAEYSDDKENPTVTLIGENSSKLIGFRGEVLDAIQDLVSAKANIGNPNYKKVVVDCENYRSKREDTLISLANKLAIKATDMKRKVVLEPMNAFERRIIHKALTNSETVKTTSEGEEPNRFVVIVPNELDESSTPYNAGRKQNDKGHNRNGKGNRGGFRKDNKKHSNNFGEKRKTTSISFGTYLGNSLKDNF